MRVIRQDKHRINRKITAEELRLVGDNVEIGANTTVDRGAGPDTVIGDGTRIDNLVQIGHNVQLGNNCIVEAGLYLTGGTKIELFDETNSSKGIYKGAELSGLSDPDLYR